MKRIVMAVGLALALPGIVSAEEEGLRLPPIDHAATLKECGGCHLAYPPQLLPSRSWDKLMGSLTDHFGEDASLDAAVRDDIAAYLAARAADAPETKDGARMLRKIGADQTPLRITETPYWVRAHSELGERTYADPKIKSKSNCQACHRTADKGEFFEDE